jgi:hypothetical protein
MLHAIGSLLSWLRARAKDARAYTHNPVSLDRLEERAMLSVTIDSVRLFTPDQGPIASGGYITLEAVTVHATDTAVGAVVFFRDSNNNGLIDPKDKILRKATRITGTENWQGSFRASKLGIGTFTVYARAVDSDGRYSTLDPSPDQGLSLTVFSGPGPQKLSAKNSFPSSVTTKLTVTANNVKAPTGAKVTGVTFYLDNNRNGVIDDGDSTLGQGKRSGSNWRLSNFTLPAETELTQTLQYLAKSTATINNAPVDGSVYKINVGPQALELSATDSKGDLRLTLARVRGGGSTTKLVNFYLDNNNNGQIDEGDTLLGKGKKREDGSSYRLTVAGESLPTGPRTYLALITNKKNITSLVYSADLDLNPIVT